MSWKSTRTRYGLVPIALHWLMLLLLAAVCATMELKSIFPRGSAQRDALAAWHYLLGLSVFVLVWLRLLARAAGTAPLIEPPPPPWQAMLARLAHGALYALMIALPLLGWLTLSARGTPVTYLGVELPALVGANKPLAGWLKEIHEALATAGYFVVGLHAAAALYHHYVRHDNTLRQMLPVR